MGIVKDQAAFSLMVYPNISIKETSLWKFGLNRSSKLQENNERRKKMPNKRQFRPESLLIFEWEVTNSTSEVAVSHNVLYYQKLSIAHYQVNCNANNYVEYVYQLCPSEPLNHRDRRLIMAPFCLDNIRLCNREDRKLHYTKTSWIKIFCFLMMSVTQS